MNIPDREIPIDEQRWQAQERAFDCARRGDADADPAELRIARALRRAPSVELPIDFAAAVARSAAAQMASLARAQAAPPSTVLEQRLLHGLVVVFALSAAVVVAWLGRGWTAELVAILPGGGNAVAWSGIAALCLLGNWSLGLLRGHGERGAGAG